MSWWRNKRNLCKDQSILGKRCCGNESSPRVYFGPREFKGGHVNDHLLQELMYGVTLFHYQCRNCGKRFVNKHIGKHVKNSTGEDAKV